MWEQGTPAGPVVIKLVAGLTNKSALPLRIMTNILCRVYPITISKDFILIVFATTTQAKLSSFLLFQVIEDYKSLSLLTFMP